MKSKFRSLIEKYIKIISSAAASLMVFALGFAVAYDDGTAVQEELIKSKGNEFFEDVKESDWFYPYVVFLSEGQVIKGKTESEFCPYDNLSVAELAALITRYHGLDGLADERREDLTTHNNVGGELWYSGYIDLMLDGEILCEGELGLSSLNGNVIIGDGCKKQLESPVSRQMAARMIARSFETDGTEFVGNSVSGDLSKYGHNFIVGGGYSDDVLESYADNIRDYARIDGEYKTDVKKCYYNGIFSGDENGFFNPHSNLTRAEAAKIIACTMDWSLRIREEHRDVDESLPLDASAKERLLQNTSKRAKTESGVLYITLENDVPFGYYIEVLVSRELYGRCYTAYRHGLMTAASDYPVYPINIDVKMTYNSEPCPIRALYILRDMTSGGDICATFEVLYGTDGSIICSSDVK